jgi:hypothetical protein
MQNQKIFFFVLAFLGLVPAGYFSVRAGTAAIDYAALKEKAPASILRWEIKERKGKFPITGFYSFEAGGKSWRGATQFAEPWNLNEASAIAAVKEKAKQNWMVWYSPADPSRSALEKEFPKGLLVRLLLCYSVFFYFIRLLRKNIRNNYN